MRRTAKKDEGKCPKEEDEYKQERIIPIMKNISHKKQHPIAGKLLPLQRNWEPSQVDSRTTWK